MKNHKATYYRKFNKLYYTSDGYDDYDVRYLEEARTVTVPTILKILRPEKNWKFLDVGCSLGGNIIALEEEGFFARGTEISEYCLENSRVKDKIVFGESFNIPFEDSSFDVVICMDVFMYLTQKEIEKSISELLRVASKYIVFGTIDKNSPNVSQKINPDELRNTSVSLYSSKDYIKLFEKAGASLLKKNFFPPSWDFSAIFIVPKKIERKKAHKFTLNTDKLRFKQSPEPVFPKSI